MREDKPGTEVVITPHPTPPGGRTTTTLLSDAMQLWLQQVHKPHEHADTISLLEQA